MIGIVILRRLCQKIRHSYQAFVFRLILQSFLYDIAVDIIQRSLACNYKSVEYHYQYDQCYE